MTDTVLLVPCVRFVAETSDEPCDGCGWWSTEHEESDSAEA